MKPFNQTTYQLPNATISGLEHKINAEKSNTILMHGYLDNAHVFYNLQPKINANTVSIDLPGHGKSSHRNQEVRHYSLLDYIFDVAQLIEKNFDNKVILIGHSLGAAIGTMIAGIFKKKIEKLVIIDFIAPLTSNPKVTTNRIRRFYERHQTEVPVSLYQSKEKAIQTRADKGISRTAAEKLADWGLNQSDQESYYWGYDRKLFLPTPLRFDEKLIDHIVSEIACDTLYLRATDGLHCRYQQRNEELINAFSSIQTIEIPGGHHMFEENPEITAKAINDFIEK